MRALQPYQAPCGKRVNVLGFLKVGAGGKKLLYALRSSSWTGLAFAEYVWQVIGEQSKPLGEVEEGSRGEGLKRKIVVLDNYSVHHSRYIKEHLEAFKAIGISFFYLPPYSPELNPIEGEWRQLKYQDLPIRSHGELEDLLGEIEKALAKRAKHFTISLAQAA